MSTPTPESAITRRDDFRVDVAAWRSDMRTTGVVYADRALFRAIQADQTLDQLVNVAALPGIVGPSLAMPDAHQGYGFPIGGVAATDASPGGDGVVSPGGVGYDINCGVRLLATSLEARDVRSRIDALCDALYVRVPAGFEKSGKLRVRGTDIESVLVEGAQWAVAQGFGEEGDLEHCEERGAHPDADPDSVSEQAKSRGAGQVGTLGSGNHFVEVQRVEEVLDPETAKVFGLHSGQLVVLIHTGSRGLGHQVCTDAVHRFQPAMKRYGIEVPDRQLACAPIHSPEGRAYLGAMAAAANFAWANRQVITARVREALRTVSADVRADVVYDVAHNMAKLEDHRVDGVMRPLCVHRKGATRAFGPGRAELPARYRATGQPAFIPGSMGTASYVIAGTERAMTDTFGSVCHGAGRLLSRTAAKKAVTADQVIASLKAQGIAIRSGSKAGIVEEFPGAYKDVHSVIDVVTGAGLARSVARLLPMAVVKG